MRLLKKQFEEEIKCPSCNYETFIGFEFENSDDVYCGNCIADIIADEFIVAKKDFNPDDYPDVYFPNWYNKEYLEDTIGRQLTNEEFQEVKKELQNSNFADEV